MRLGQLIRSLNTHLLHHNYEISRFGTFSKVALFSLNWASSSKAKENSLRRGNHFGANENCTNIFGHFVPKFDENHSVGAKEVSLQK